MNETPLETLTPLPAPLIPWSTHPSKAEIHYRTAGYVRTIGTVFLPPPSDSLLLSTANYLHKPHKPNSLTVAGKALSKHYVRQTSHPFWPVPKGPANHISALAEGVCKDILREGDAWRNICFLQKGVLILEVRNWKGYGVRWSIVLKEGGEGEEEGNEEDREIERIEFRGFLERVEDVRGEENQS